MPSFCTTSFWGDVLNRKTFMLTFHYPAGATTRSSSSSMACDESSPLFVPTTGARPSDRGVYSKVAGAIFCVAALAAAVAAISSNTPWVATLGEGGESEAENCENTTAPPYAVDKLLGPLTSDMRNAAMEATAAAATAAAAASPGLELDVNDASNLGRHQVGQMIMTDATPALFTYQCDANNCGAQHPTEGDVPGGIFQYVDDRCAVMGGIGCEGAEGGETGCRACYLGTEAATFPGSLGYPQCPSCICEEFGESTPTASRSLSSAPIPPPSLISSPHTFSFLSSFLTFRQV